VPATAPPTHGLRREARHFLAAFLAYEVGDLGPGLARQLRATSSPAFHHELLANRPDPAALSAAAKLTRLSAVGLSGHPPRALVSGSARRRGGKEEFAFLFERREGRWLAAGAAE
jgi:hypothetical protein